MAQEDDPRSFPWVNGQSPVSQFFFVVERGLPYQLENGLGLLRLDQETSYNESKQRFWSNHLLVSQKKKINTLFGVHCCQTSGFSVKIT